VLAGRVDHLLVAGIVGVETVDLKFNGCQQRTQLVVKVRGDASAFFFKGVDFGLYFFLVQP
jgi:hypothetical protein